MSTEKALTGYPSIDKPWLKYYSEEAIHDPLPDSSIFEYLWENNKTHPTDIAIFYLGKKITYRELFEKIDQAAIGFQTLNVRPGDIVTVALPCIPEAIYVVYALNKIGAVANMIHPLAGEQELLNYLNEVESTVAVLFDGTYRLLENSLHRTSVEKAIIISAGESLPFGLKQLYSLKNKKPDLAGKNHYLYWNSFLKAGEGKTLAPFKRDPRELAVISHTGGTTGEPKGVMISDRNANAVVWQILNTIENERQQRMLVQLPPFINYSLVNGAFEPLAGGVTVYLVPDYQPKKIGYYLKKYKPNHINSIPQYLEAMLQDPTIQNMDLSFLLTLVSGGDGMSAETEERLNALLLSRGAKRVAKGYGMTEVVSSATFTFDRCNEAGSIGIPLVKVNCKIVDPDTNQELTYGEVGEVCFAGDTIMLGYYKNQQATDELIEVDNHGIRWIHTGDLGYITNDGLIFLSGRMKRIIAITGKDGVPTKLFPDRIEKAAYKHSSVRLCCAIGVPDTARNYYPKLYVVLKDALRNQEIVSEELLALCQKELPEYMIPEEIEYCDDLPRTERGKIDYRALEEDAKRKV